MAGALEEAAAVEPTLGRRDGFINASLFALFTVCFLAAAFIRAGRKPFWADEIFTAHLARIRGLARFWEALKDGPDQSGPLGLMVVKGCYGLFGEGREAARMPGAVGVWAMVLFLLLIVGRRRGAWYAWAGALFPLTTEARSYTCEARPYGLWLGFTGGAFLAWQLAAEGRRRPWALVGLAVSMGAAVACHYYAVLVLAALGLGEVARTWDRRRLDLGVWVALAASLTPIALLLPVIRAARAFSANFWAKPSWPAIPATYNWLFQDAAGALAIALALIVLAAAYLGRGRGPAPGPSPRHEIVAAAVLAALPVLAVLLGMAVTGAYTERYALPTVVGLAVLLPEAVARLQVRLAGPALALAIAAWVGALGLPQLGVRGPEAQVAAAAPQPGRPGAPPVAADGADPGRMDDLPIATYDLHLYIESNFYRPPSFNARLTYLTGVGGSAKSNDPYIVRLKPWVTPERPVHYEDLDTYIAGHPRFLVLEKAGPGLLGPLLDRLRPSGTRLRLVEALDEDLIFEATPPPAGPGPGPGPPDVPAGSAPAPTPPPTLLP